MNRRRAIITGATGLALLSTGIYFMKPSAKGGPYSPYFAVLNQSLKAHKPAIPRLIIDLDLLDQNIETLKNTIKKEMAYRVVVKSLPSKDLVEYVMKKANTKKLMVFHLPFLNDVTKSSGTETDILIGKPFPVSTATHFYTQRKTEERFNPEKQLQWLIDTKARLKQYLQMAESLGVKLRINLEIDVGLRRGGFQDIESLSEALNIIKENPDKLKFSGFMGYDAHVVNVPQILLSRERAFKNANDFYTECIRCVKENYAELWNEHLTLNGAGSPTLLLHKQKDSVINDVAAGSCLLKPTDFDIDTLEEFVPASFIASPVLKKFEHTELASIERFKKLMSVWNPNLRQSFFIYGGAWKANYIEPPGVKGNTLFESTNQTLINASDRVQLDVDDFVFLRPHQSEFVFLQFGNILTLRNGRLEGEWKLLDETI